MNDKIQKILMVEIETIKLMNYNCNLIDELVEKLSLFMQKGKLWMKDTVLFGKVSTKDGILSFDAKTSRNGNNKTGLEINFYNKKTNVTESILLTEDTKTNEKQLLSIKRTDLATNYYNNIHFDKNNKITFEEKNKNYRQIHNWEYYVNTCENSVTEYYYEKELVLKRQREVLTEDSKINCCKITHTIIDQNGISKEISTQEAYEYLLGKTSLEDLFNSKQKRL